MFDDTDQNLVILGEECVEVAKLIFKIQRFGLFNHHPDNAEKQNIDLLIEEIGHVLAAIDIVKDSTVMTWQDIMAAKQRKKEKLQKWYNT